MRYARDIWLQIIQQFETSGLTQEQYAEKRGIPVGTLRSWIYKVRRQRHEEDTPLLPVRVVASTAPLARQGGDEAGIIEVAVGSDVRLRFPLHAPASTIAQVVSLLRARC